MMRVAPSFIAFLVLLACPCFESWSANISDAPRAIRELAVNIQGKQPNEVREEIIRRFGANPRHVGSGIKIELWNLPEGNLRFHPLLGPTFEDPRSKRRYWLLNTSNAVGANVRQSYEMSSLPDPANHGSQYWLGNLELKSDSTYHFTDAGAFPDQRAAQAGNFFMLNPTGTVELHYAAPIAAETLLEHLEEGSIVASLVFTSADRRNTATFSIASSENDRKLTFQGDEPLSFEMRAGWRSFWQ